MAAGPEVRLEVAGQLGAIRAGIRDEDPSGNRSCHVEKIQLSRAAFSSVRRSTILVVISTRKTAAFAFLFSRLIINFSSGDN